MAQVEIGRVVAEKAPDFTLFLQRVNREGVQGEHHVGALKAVGPSLLSVDDRRGVAEVAKDGALNHAEQKLISPRHGVEENVQAKVRNQVFRLQRQFALPLKVAIGVHEERFHRRTRSSMDRRVSPYFWAIEVA